MHRRSGGGAGGGCLHSDFGSELRKRRERDKKCKDNKYSVDRVEKAISHLIHEDVAKISRSRIFISAVNVWAQLVGRWTNASGNSKVCLVFVLKRSNLIVAFVRNEKHSTVKSFLAFFLLLLLLMAPVTS